ncbi:MAG: hypothetical protein ISS12_14775 [Candidatus Marinimicrobia bacterium]|nr:hypothetical protein [Candidatus Neomarinimicrobiota bacterium]
MTKKYKEDLRKAMNCAEKGKAYHWPTVAEILADEVKRLRDIEKRIDSAQTAIMYDVDGGHLSSDRDSIHNREVDVALVVLEGS